MNNNLAVKYCGVLRTLEALRDLNRTGYKTKKVAVYFDAMLNAFLEDYIQDCDHAAITEFIES